MTNYYEKKLSANKLKRSYQIAPLRVKQYLDAELDHVCKKIKASDVLLDLGCGYGRILPKLAAKASKVIGIDISRASLDLAAELLSDIPNCRLIQMSAINLDFEDHTFDVVVCIQNGISAFHVDQKDLIEESIRVTKPGGIILFSSYSHKFWQDRLHWFELQAQHGLLGEIDNEKTQTGIIICKDGFVATTVNDDQFLALSANFDVAAKVVEVDESSLFCEIIPH